MIVAIACFFPMSPYRFSPSVCWKHKGQQFQKIATKKEKLGDLRITGQRYPSNISLKELSHSVILLDYNVNKIINKSNKIIK